jgi:hypothetical protein
MPFYGQLRGSSLFFKEVRNKVNALLRQGKQLPVSTFSWFLTFSPADTYWPELFKAALPNLSDEEILLLSGGIRTQILCNYPELAAQLFWCRWKLFLKHILHGKSHPVGRIVDFFFRVEFQGRGSPHIHMLAYVLEAAHAADWLTTPDGLDKVAKLVEKYVKAWVLPIDGEFLLCIPFQLVVNIK